MRIIRFIISIILFFYLLGTLFAQEKTATLSKVGSLEAYTTEIGEAKDVVVIGDMKHPTVFSPEITFTKWQNEYQLKIIPDKSWFSGEPTLSADGKELKITGQNVDFYCKLADEDLFKFGLILHYRPRNTETWTFNLDGYTDVVFIKQDEWKEYKEFYLTKEQSPWGVEGIHIEKTDEPHKGAWRLPRVQGSYAIYHKEKKWQAVGSKDYGTGKIGVFYRPKLLDAYGNVLGFADISITEGKYILSISNIPQEIIDKAELPLRFNDEFGNTTIGGSNDWIQSGIIYTPTASWSTGGTITSMQPYVSNPFTTAYNIICALYSTSSGVPQSRLVVSSAASVGNTSGTWANCSVSDTQRSSGTYGLAMQVGNSPGLRYFYDYPGGNFYADTGETYPNFPTTFSNDYYDATYISIRVIYTPSGGGGGGGGEVTQSQPGIANGIMRGVFR